MSKSLNGFLRCARTCLDLREPDLEIWTRKSIFFDREKLETIADTLGIDYSNKNDEELRKAINREVGKEGK